MGTTIINISKPQQVEPTVTVYFGVNNEYNNNVIARVWSSFQDHYNINIDNTITLVIYTDQQITANNTVYNPYIVLNQILTGLQYVQTIQNIVTSQVIYGTTVYNTISIPVNMIAFTNTINANQTFSYVATVTIGPDSQYNFSINI